ncbi:hypothetical protein KFK09_023914 [Dendrobium nobile]|uniref:Uncharacterized protein n=1 Tax=Dendrobium nobile TaxID=94219 RepID=A0A8T3ACE8_DENNO|nr:hypothetical protein KFK09_023914 [Dendrobium nobile]
MSASFLPRSPLYRIKCRRNEIARSLIRLSFSPSLSLDLALKTCSLPVGRKLRQFDRKEHRELAGCDRNFLPHTRFFGSLCCSTSLLRRRFLPVESEVGHLIGSKKQALACCGRQISPFTCYSGSFAVQLRCFDDVSFLSGSEARHFDRRQEPELTRCEDNFLPFGRFFDSFVAARLPPPPVAFPPVGSEVTTF